MLRAILRRYVNDWEWLDRARHRLGLDYVPGGVGANGDDNINYFGLVTVPSLQADFSHPICKIAGVDGVSAISASLPATRK